MAVRRKFLSKKWATVDGTSAVLLPTPEKIESTKIDQLRDALIQMKYIFKYFYEKNIIGKNLGNWSALPSNCLVISLLRIPKVRGQIFDITGIFLGKKFFLTKIFAFHYTGMFAF